MTHADKNNPMGPKCETTDKPRLAGSRRALMIACAFPPTGGSGVQRPAKFSKYLARLGWEIDVWSGHNLPGFPRDASLLADLPTGVTRLGLSVWDFHAPAQMGLPRRLLRKVMRLLSYPDERLEWVLRSLHPLYRRLQRRPVDVIVATYSPPSNLLLAWGISRLTGTPWIADLRDLWTDDCTYLPRTRLRRWMDTRVERRLLRSADAVVAVSTGQARILASHVPLPPGKLHTITNGVDLEDFTQVETSPASTVGILRATARCNAEWSSPQVIEARHGLLNDNSRQQRLVLTHVGRLERQRFSDAILAGFGQFAATHAEEAQKLQLLLVGHVNSALLELLRKSGVEVVATGALEHAGAIRQMMASDWLLLPTAHGRNAESLIPGKTFEYLASGRPLWVLGYSNTEVWQRVNALHAGRLCNPAPESVATGLKALVTEWEAGQTPSGCAREAVSCYGRDQLAARLSQVMECVIAERRRRHNTKRRSQAAGNCQEVKVRGAGSRLSEAL